MEGEGAEELLLDGEVLHKLRRQLDEIPPHVGAAETLETGVGKHPVEGVSELVEEGLHLTQRQQGGLLGCGFGEVHHHRNVGTDILAVIWAEGLLCIEAFLPLALIFRHPGTGLLSLTGMEVGIEDGEIAAILVEDLVGLDVGMIDGDVLVFLEGDAIEAVGEAEDTVDDFRQLEIGPQHLGIDVVFLQLQLVGVE